MTKIDFWQKWLFIVALIISVFGLFLALFNQSLFFDLVFNNQIDPIFWGRQDSPEVVSSYQGWIYGVLGATVCGWGITLAFIAHYPFKQREQWAWNCILIGMTTWFIVDTSLSITFNVYFNALFNLLIFTLVFIPLIFSRKMFLK